MRRLFKGLTLIELLVAVGILVIAVVGLLAMLVNCIVLNETNRNLFTAVNDVQYVLEQIKALDFDNIDESSFTPPSFSNLDNEQISNFDVEDISNNLKEVTVDVSWTDKGQSRTFSLSTLIAR